MVPVSKLIFQTSSAMVCLEIVLPFALANASKSLYCAGYYIIKFRKGWVKSFCPKLITLERYQYQGPFKTETEMRSSLNAMSRS